MSTPPASSNGDQSDPWPGTGVVTLECSVNTHVDELLAALLRMLEADGLEVLAVIDHSGDAAEVGILMPDTKLVVFGNATFGTPLMLENPLVALDLPTKLLLWTDHAGRTYVSYNDAGWVADRYQLSETHRPVLRRVAAFATRLAEHGSTPDS